MKHARGKDRRGIVSSRVSERKRMSEARTTAPRTTASKSTASKTTASKPTSASRSRDLASKGTARTTAESAVKRKINKRKKRNKVWRTLLSIGLVLLGLLLIVAVVGLLWLWIFIYKPVEAEMNELDFEAIAYNYTSVVYAYDQDGNVIEVEHLHNDGNREWISNDEIPQYAKDAAVSIEDERFYSHKGIDFKRTTGAVAGWFTAKLTGGSPSFGGSTITQQVIKNLTQEKDKTVTRKVKEMARAVAFEKRFTKEEILSTYLNISYFGNQCYGIESASKMYFSKPASELTLPEAAMIVGITQAPTKFDPFKNPENAKTKRNTVLMKMHELGKISKKEYEAAIKSPLGVNDSKVVFESTVYNYFIDQVINDVIEDLQEEKGYTKMFAESQVFGGGLKIYITMDPQVQSAMEEVYADPETFAGAQTGTQSAMVIIDPKTGQIKGMVGGVGQKKESRGLNRATQSKRQPGSSIKPISVYGPALEYDEITASEIIVDAPLSIGEWSPKNSYSNPPFRGSMSVRAAIRDSANIPAVKTLQKVGVGKSYDFMTKELGFTSLTTADRDLSPLSLGGLTKGVSPKEMAAAYAMFANKGVYIEPYTYTKVVDKSGKVILENDSSSRRVMSEANAYIMSSFLKDVVSSGTGTRARLSGITAYGKTGTSNDAKDRWFCGYTAHYVGATWYGFDNNKPLSGNSNYAAEAWRRVMTKVHTNIPAGKLVREIPKPDSVTAVSVCQLTGKLASNGCGHGKTEYYAKGTVPSAVCDNDHTSVVPPKNWDGTTFGVEEEPENPETPETSETPSPTTTPQPSTEPEKPKPPKNEDLEENEE